MAPAKKPAATSSAKAVVDPDLDVVASLADILNSAGLTEIELERKGTRFRVSKSVTTVAAAPAAYAPAAAPAQPHAASAAEAAAPSKPAGADHPGTVKSPMVGTVYRAPSPCPCG